MKISDFVKKLLIFYGILCGLMLFASYHLYNYVIPKIKENSVKYSHAVKACEAKGGTWFEAYRTEPICIKEIKP